MTDPQKWQSLCSELERLDAFQVKGAVRGANTLSDALVPTEDLPNQPAPTAP